jgi:hypothetical protein
MAHYSALQTARRRAPEELRIQTSRNYIESPAAIQHWLDMRLAGEAFMLTARAREQSKLERTDLDSVALSKDDELGKD